MPTVALIEDSKELSDVYAGALRKSEINVDQFFDVDTARDSIKKNDYDGYLLDLDLGHILYDGLSLVEDIKDKLNDSDINATTPILIVSGHNPNDYKAISQKFFTAWDNVQKPVDLAELVSMTWMMINFSEEQKNRKPCVSNRLTLKNAEVYWDKKRVHGVSMIPYRFLQCLIDNIDETVKFNDLYSLTNGYESDFVKTKGVVRVHINRLRQSFKDIDPEFSYIKSSRSQGFMWSSDGS